MQISVKKEELYGLIKQAIREVLHEEEFGLYLKSIPPVSNEEMEDIGNLYGKPSSKKKSAFSETIKI